MVNFLKGFVSLIVAWIFCDDMADWLMNKTEAGIKTMTLLSDSLTSKWESSDIYLSLPEVFKESGEFATSLIESGTEKLTSSSNSNGMCVYGWMTVSGLFSRYVEHASGYASIFGPVYVVALAMLWLYFCISILFYGGVLNRFLINRWKPKGIS